MSNPNIVLKTVFSTYLPEYIGIIDYHGAHRNFQREGVSSFYTNSSMNEQYRNSTLYNYNNKYTNIKNEIASSYVNSLIAKASIQPVQDESISDLNTSLSELFDTFFQRKKFNGIVPTIKGQLEFPVVVSENISHDINELSSGEKEILFGYLKLKNLGLKNSIILIDEPELHLNPRMAKKLPEFYFKWIGKKLNNQIWLVTHSEAILSEAVKSENTSYYSVFHLKEASEGKCQENQAIKIQANQELESAILDLVGDISNYNPNNKILICEGENSEFDKWMISNLFPDFVKSVTLLSVGSKTKVVNLHSLLKKASKEGGLDRKFYSITDKDSEIENKSDEINHFNWNVYHIENYLIEPKFIFESIRSIIQSNIMKENEIEEKLKEIAEQEVVNEHIRHEAYQLINSELKSITNLKSQEYLSDDELANSYFKKLNELVDNLRNKLDANFKEEEINLKIKEIRNKYIQSLKNEDWKKIIQGRKILQSFVGKYLNGQIKYIAFRNLIINKMKDNNYQPSSMKEVIEKILND